MSLQVQMVGKYTHQQKGFQISSFYGIGLNVSGLVSTEMYFPDGTMGEYFGGNGTEEGACLILAVPGNKLHFEYTANRENWIIFLKEPCPFRYDSEKKTLVYDDGLRTFEIARKVPLQHDEVPDVRRMFQTVRNCISTGSVKDQLRAEILAMELLLRFCGPEESRETAHPSAAELFRDKITADLRCEKSLDELASEIGYGRDHLRKLFIRQYGIAPGEFRVRQRLSRVMQLLSDTDLSMKEIAETVGIPHVSYLNILIRKQFHTTPGELRRKFRFGAV